MTTVATPNQTGQSTMSEKSTELVKHQPTVGTVIATPQEFSTYLAQQRQAHAHVLSPVTDLGALPDNWVMVPSAVKINADENAGEVYADRLFCKNDEVALTKVGLRKIAKAAGISWKVVREDSGTVPNYWAMKCTISYRGHDGLPKEAEASYEWDLRDGSPRLQKSDGVMGGKELNRARLNGYRRCEAGAINAAIREYGLKQKYTKAELARPFVVFNVVFQPQTDEQRNMLAQAALTGVSTLYSGAVAELPAATMSGRVVDALPAGAAVPEEVPFDDGAAEADAPDLVARIVSVTMSSGTDDFFVAVEGGRKLHTNDRGIAKVCNDARKANAQVSFFLDGNDITEVTAQPTTADKF